MAALLARVVREHGRDDEALALTQAAEHAAADHDLDAQVRWRTVRAPILARRGHGQQAEELAREALDLARKTGAPILQADTLFDLAVVPKSNGDLEGARTSLDEAIALYMAKGDRVSSARARSWGTQAFKE